MKERNHTRRCVETENGLLPSHPVRRQAAENADADADAWKRMDALHLHPPCTHFAALPHGGG